jgi:hypothetical protein
MKTLAMAFTILGLIPLSAQAEVTKEDIRKLVAAGISEEIVLTYIRTNGPAARLSTDDLIELKSAGVSDRVLTALLPGSRQAPSPSYAAPAPRSEVVERTVYQPQTTYVDSAPSYGYVDFGFSYDPWYSNCYSGYRYPVYGSSCYPSYRYGFATYNSACAGGRFGSVYTGRSSFASGNACSSRGGFSSGFGGSGHVRR